MANHSEEPAAEAMSPEQPVRITWRTPVLIEEAIVESTQHRFSAGIDRYEGSNPVGYGS